MANEDVLDQKLGVFQVRSNFNKSFGCLLADCDLGNG